jgi:uncharacterized cupin superfamily protein
MADRRHPNVINLAEAEPRTLETGTKFGGTFKSLGGSAGGAAIGCSWYEVKPGRAAYPCHFHCANEEAAFILEGEGTARIGDATVAVRAGDYIAFPVGPAHAHQIRNTGTTPLRYLTLSTLNRTEVVGYPDSKKIGAMASPSYEAAMKGQHWIRYIGLESSAVPYFEGEDAGEPKP